MLEHWFCGATGTAKAKPANPAKNEGKISHFSRFSISQPNGDEKTEALEERIAIIAHDGGIPDRWAEALARVDQAAQPEGMPPEEWQCTVNAAGLLLDALKASSGATCLPVNNRGFTGK